MQMDLTDSQRELLSKLWHAVRRSNRGRILRAGRSPLKAIRVRYLKWVGKTRKVRARTFWGGQMDIILPERVSRFIWKHGYFEADVCAYMIVFLRRGMSFVDIGTHFGFFALLAAHLIKQEGRIIAFEPSCRTYRHLQENINRYCTCPNIYLCNSAAYSKNGWAQFCDYGLEDSAFNSMFRPRDVREPSTDFAKIRVQTRRVDDVLGAERITAVDMIKIDAESCEMHVLTGLERTLQACRPKLIVEVGDFDIPGVPASRQLIQHLRQLGYRPFDIRDGEISPHVVQDRYEYGNLLFVHGNRGQ